MNNQNFLDDILKDVNLENINSEFQNFPDLPDGYYLATVEKVEFKLSKNTGSEMIAWQFRTVENGIKFNDDFKKEYIPNTQNRKIFIYHSLKNKENVERAISDLLKFEQEPGVSVIKKEHLNSRENIQKCFELLIGGNIFLHLEANKDGSDQWKRMLSWKAAEKLELIED